MNDDNKKSPNTESTEQEIRKNRPFDLAEAIGREAAGALKGASPVAAARQLLLEIEHLLDSHLYDPDASLTRTLLATLENNPPLLARHFSDAAGALREYLTTVLTSQASLEGLVRQADARWGRDYGEKPHFNRPGQQDHPDDPYTPDGVRRELTRLLDSLD